MPAFDETSVYCSGVALHLFLFQTKLPLFAMLVNTKKGFLNDDIRLFTVSQNFTNVKQSEGNCAQNIPFQHMEYGQTVTRFSALMSGQLYKVKWNFK